MTEKEAITPFDSWWDQFGKAILNRHNCAKAAGVAERDRLIAMLRRLEHQGRDADRTPICPVCLATDLEPHYANCELNALLGEAQEQQS